jgi:glucosyl-3-phosphoglycerate synthase
MADFHQSGPITTLHRLRSDRLSSLEADLLKLSRHTGIGLVLPALFSEFERPAMRRIVAELREVAYLSRIVVAVGGATRAQMVEARQFFEDFQAPVTVLWIDDPRIEEFLRHLEHQGLPAGQDGKGRACWLAFGYLLAEGACSVFALHDCDIVDYDREILASLCYPVAHPSLPFDFCKAFYARVTGRRLQGRVTRLFVSPLLRALRELAPESGLLTFLESFRYPLAGECSMSAALARQLQVPGDWGLEIGSLAEVYRRSSLRRVCQVEVAENYDHKHQPLCADDPSRGLRRMTIDIAGALLRAAAAEDVVVAEEGLWNLAARYQRLASDMVHRYAADAAVNGLFYDRHEEESMVRIFSRSLHEAGLQFLRDRCGAAPLPSWDRVEAAVPGALESIRECGAPRRECGRVSAGAPAEELAGEAV